MELFSYGTAVQKVNRIIHMVELLEVPGDRVGDLNRILDLLEEIEGDLNAANDRAAPGPAGTSPAHLGT